jgi:ribosomal protein S18 acetylase RimI-like enzyme
MLRPLTAADIPALSALAHRIWRAHYTGIVSAQQIEYMLAELLSEKILMRQLEESSPRYTLAEMDGILAGFITCARRETYWFIDKFYVDPSLQGQGIGNALLRHVTESLPKKSELRLRVNRYNIHSINYYFHRGFSIESVVDSPFGPFTLNDYVMVKRL